MPKLINLDNLEEYSVQLKEVLDKYIKSPNESIKNIVELTYAEYQELVQADEVDPNTEYHIKDATPSLDDIQAALDYLQAQIDSITPGSAGESLPVGSELEYVGLAEDIPDGWGTVSDPDVYSLDEVKTYKTWIDGKPIYRKVISAGAIAAQREKRIDISNIPFETIVNVSGFMQSSQFPHIPILFYNNNWNYTYVEYNQLVVGVGWAATNTYLTLEYTKTTN